MDLIQTIGKQKEVEITNKDGVEVDKSEMIHQCKGLRAKREFSPHEKIFDVKGRHVKNRTERTLQIDTHEHIDPVNAEGEPEPGYYLNHSCNPNAYSLVNENEYSKLLRLEVFAIKDIGKGKEITVDYAFMESEIANPCKCSCGASNCRGKITGFKELKKEDVETYLNMNIPISNHLLKLYK